MKLTLRFMLMASMGLVCLWGQKGGGTSGGTSGGASTGTTGTSTTGTGSGSNPVTSPTSPANPPTTSPAPATPVATLPKPIYLSGIVIVDDGSPLPANVNIQSVCASRQRTVANTSSDGSFGFMWGDTAGVFEDASENVRSPGNGSGSGSGSGLSGTGSGGGSSVRPTDPLADCDLRANFPGYTSSKVSLYQHAAFDRFDVGAIVLHRITGDEGRVVSLLSLKAPKDAKKNFDKGTEQARANKLTDAALSFQKSVAGYPQYADAWLSLGRVESQLGATDAAREDFQKAMDLDDKLVGPWQELGYMASDQSRWEDAARYLDRAVRLDPMNSPMAWYFSAMANYNLGRFDQAERSVRAEIKLDKNPRAQYLLGLVLIARKDLRGGAEALRIYLASSPKPEDAELARKQLSRVEGQLSQ
jgi:tetratricopeptide (TPR) repeat protein